MFGSLIYFIIIILVYGMNEPSETRYFTFPETVALFSAMFIVFFCLTFVQFKSIERRISKGESVSDLDRKFNSVLTRQSAMAVLVFAADIHWLNLTSYFAEVPFFSLIPALYMPFFLGLAAFYIVTVWTCAHNSYQKLYASDFSRRSYIMSNLSFATPILILWLLLFGIADIIEAMPFEPVNSFFSSAKGQLLYLLFSLCAITAGGPDLLRIFWRCKPLEPGYNRGRIENLCRKTGVEYANILYWPIFGGKMITAGVMGLIKKFRYFLVTDALFHHLQPEEIDSVIVHEIGHVKKKHLLFYLLLFMGNMLLAVATLFLLIFIIHIKPGTEFLSSIIIGKEAILYQSVVTIFFLIYLRYIFGYFMRNFERQADAYVYTIFENASPLISTFEKITMTSGQPPDKPNWHHFSITERIEFLKKCETDKTHIIRHDRKIKKSIAFFFIGAVLMGSIVYSLYNLYFFENRVAVENRLLKEIENNPGKTNLYNMLGDIYLSRKNYEKTITVYEKAISLDPKNAHALNNLAWLFATCENMELRDSKRAVMLAQRAADQTDIPHILDTLAESYYADGQFRKAVSAGKRALGLIKKDRSYFKSQLEKFEKAEKEVRSEK
ncbi:MAG: M48 family metalloprotease [Desulfobacteraceae bacterium]|nr:M48 family metalloprotease [Desulfobacteraceae bacterium]